jgi:bifunctional non-homologous end joining protein LigD
MARPRAKPPLIGAKAPLPGFVEPALTSSITKVPSGDRWIHEVEFDGYRVQVHLANAAVRIFTRRGNDWTNRFKKIADDAWHIRDHRWRGDRPVGEWRLGFLGTAE